MASNWQKFKQLKSSQWLVILVSPFALLVNWLRLRRSGYQKTLGCIRTLPDSGASPENQLATARETAFALAVAVRIGPWWPKCLLRSLTLGWLLARRGIPFVIRIGVPIEEGPVSAQEPVDFRAHAWVEHAGIVLNDRQDIAADFSAFDGGPGTL